MVLRDITNQKFSPFLDDELVFGSIADPWPQVAELRRASPISKGSFGSFFDAPPDPSTAGRDCYTLWTYDGVSQVLKNPGLFSSAIIHKIGVEKAFGRILVVMDPPDHTRYRQYLQRVFSPRAVKSWNDQLIRPLIEESISDFSGDGEAELVSQFTRRFPFEIVFRLLDLPRTDIGLFEKLAVTQTFVTTPFFEEATEAGQNLADYFTGLLAERRERPGDDLVSLLAQVEINGIRLEEDVLIALLRHILNAAADTSFRTTGCLLVALLTQPGLLDTLRNDLNALPNYIEEVLRWEGPVTNNFRTLTRDHVMFGEHMPAGSVIYTAQGSANRDEAYFDEPNLFNPARTSKVSHLGFGTGPHVCIGMHLARLQIKEAVSGLLTSLPALRLDTRKPPPSIRGFAFRAPPALHVTF